MCYNALFDTVILGISVGPLARPLLNTGIYRVYYVYQSRPDKAFSLNVSKSVNVLNVNSCGAVVHGHAVRPNIALAAHRIQVHAHCSLVPCSGGRLASDLRPRSILL